MGIAPGTRLAFIGLGGMGAGMALRLLGSGFPVVVHNRTASRTEPVAAAGAVTAGSPSAAVAGVEVVLLSLADEAAVEEVLFGQVVPALPAGTLVVDTSTVSPGYARAAARRLAERGLRRVEACVIGNPQMARAGELRVLAAGAEEDVDAVQPVLDALGQQVRYLGPPGAAATMKLAFNLLLGAQTVALAEAVGFGVSAGLDRDLLLTAIANSGFSSPVLSFRAEFMQRRTYQPPAFRTSLMHKDLRLALDEADAAGVRLPVARSAADRFADLIATGHGDDDAAAVIEDVVGRPA